MKPSVEPSDIVQFGAFEVDFHSGELRRHGHQVKLQEKPYQILEILLEQPGRMVSREELTKRLWPDDTFVDFERGLNTAIGKLRTALGDSAEHPRYIETVARRGYRFIGSSESSAGFTERPSANRKTVLVAVLGAAVVALMAGYFLLWRDSAPTRSTLHPKIVGPPVRKPGTARGSLLRRRDDAGDHESPGDRSRDWRDFTKQCEQVQEF